MRILHLSTQICTVYKYKFNWCKTLLWILRFDFTTWLLIEENITCEYIDFGVISTNHCLSELQSSFVLSLNTHKFYWHLHLNDNDILAQTYYAEISISASSMKSTELPEVPRGFSVPLTKVNENASPSLISCQRTLCGVLHFPVTSCSVIRVNVQRLSFPALSKC